MDTVQLKFSLFEHDELSTAVAATRDCERGDEDSDRRVQKRDNGGRGERQRGRGHKRINRVEE